MRKSNVLEILTDIEDQYLMETWEECCTGKRTHHNMWKVAAAVLVVVLSFGTVAAKQFGIWLKEKHSGREESGYTIQFDEKFIDQKKLHGQLDQLRDTIVEQYKNHDILSSDTPGHYYQSFQTKQEAADFIGYDRLLLSDWKYKPSDEFGDAVSISIEGKEDGTIDNLSLENHYVVDGIHLQEITTLYFEGTKLSPDIMFSDDEHIEYTESKIRSESGEEWLVMDSAKSENGYYSKDAYIFKAGVLYNLYMAYEDKKGKDTAEQLMQEWIDSFHF